MINLLKNIFSISNDYEKRKLIKLLGFKIKFPKLYYLKQRKQNPYLKFKKENFLWYIFNNTLLDEGL